MLPEDAADKRAQWSSSDNAIATVNDNSTVTAVGEVTATITVTNVDRGKTAYGLVPKASAAAQHIRFGHLDELLRRRRHSPRACRQQGGLRSRHGLAEYFHGHYRDVTDRHALLSVRPDGSRFPSGRTTLLISSAGRWTRYIANRYSRHFEVSVSLPAASQLLFESRSSSI